MNEMITELERLLALARAGKLGFLGVAFVDGAHGGRTCGAKAFTAGWAGQLEILTTATMLRSRAEDLARLAGMTDAEAETFERVVEGEGQ